MMLFTKVLVMISGIIIAFAACGQDVGNGEDPAPTVPKVDADGGQATDALAGQVQEVDLVLEDKFIQYFVKLKLDESNDDLKVDDLKVDDLKADDLKVKCKKFDHPGCLLFGKNQRGSITFYLPGYKKDNAQCPEAKNVITRIELTTKAEDVFQKKGDFDRTLKLDPWVKINAFSHVKLDTGIVYDAQWDEAWAQTTLFNLNNHKHEIERDRSFWYRVTVKSCPKKEYPSETWVVDPRGDNEGLD